MGKRRFSKKKGNKNYLYALFILPVLLILVVLWMRSGKTKEKTSNGNYDRYGYDRSGYNRYGYDKYGYDKYGYNSRGINQSGVKRKTEVTHTNESTNTNSSCVSGEYICVNQFLVNKEGIIQWYNLTGNNCRTNCSYRPISRPCPK